MTFTKEQIEELVIDQEPPLRRFVDRFKAWTPGIIGAFTFFTIYIAVRSEPNWGISSEQVSADNVAVLGTALTTTYSLPFEFASILLLAALIGAIMLAKADPKGVVAEETER